ncbi:MAG: L,D-transpeptidase family protein [Mariprofundaceae bacterium]
MSWRSVLFMGLLLLWQPAVADEFLARGDLRAMHVLSQGDSKEVQDLPASEQMVLKATLALKEDNPQRALDYLKGGDIDGDPLIALLEAEAHRRSAVKAVMKAGDYARGLKDERQRLEQADLSAGLSEADVRLHAFIDKLDGVYGRPVDLLQLGSDIRNVFMVDKGRSRMFVYERASDGSFTRVADEYIVTGAKAGDKQSRGDARTPNGIYRFVKRLSGDSLPPRYGPVAFPIDYPNALDQLHKKDGSGIWMHGYPADVGRRPPRDTKGCFALPNSRLVQMAEYVKLGQSWVIVGENFEFDNDDVKQGLLSSVKSTLENWRSDWVSLNTDAYLKHYHTQFRSGKRDLAAWKRYKHRVNDNKKFVDVQLSDISLIHDPSKWAEGEIVVAEFDQHYRSSNYQDVSRKRLYLARTSQTSPWRVLLEESVE